MKLAFKNWRRPQNGELGVEWDAIHVKKWNFQNIDKSHVLYVQL
jgi:hypothetical protein